MAVRYTKFQSTHKVDVVGAVTLTGSADDIKVIDLTAAPHRHGVHWFALVIQNASLNGDITLKAKGNTAANGSGTDVTLQTMTIDSADTDAVLEIPCELLSHFSDRNDLVLKSLIFEATGTQYDTLDAVVVTKPMQEQDGLTPSDPTTVT